MKHIKFILIALYIPLLISCKDCFFCWDCFDEPEESFVHFDNADKVGIKLIAVSKFSDRTTNDDGVASTLSSFESGGALSLPGKRTGVDLLKSYQNCLAHDYDGLQFLLWMNEKKEIVLVWDLADTTQRWADESLWIMDSSFHEICGGREMQVQYSNTYTFSDEDFAE